PGGLPVSTRSLGVSRTFGLPAAAREGRGRRAAREVEGVGRVVLPGAIRPPGSIRQASRCLGAAFAGLGGPKRTLRLGLSTLSAGEPRNASRAATLTTVATRFVLWVVTTHTDRRVEGTQSPGWAMVSTGKVGQDGKKKLTARPDRGIT